MSESSVTAWLHRLRDGDAQALDRLLPLVYDELRGLARAQLADERSAHTINPTALVHEAYVRLTERERLNPDDRRHFFAIAAQAMRRVMIDYARARRRQKRGGGKAALPLADEPAFLTDAASDELVALDDALRRLAAASPRVAQVVEQRFFGGLTLDETAVVLGVSMKTVHRDWILARAWLRKEVGAELAALERLRDGGQVS